MSLYTHSQVGPRLMNVGQVHARSKHVHGIQYHDQGRTSDCYGRSTQRRTEAIARHSFRMHYRNAQTAVLSAFCHNGGFPLNSLRIQVQEPSCRNQPEERMV